MKSSILSLIFLLFITFTLDLSAYPLVPNPDWAQGSLCTRSHGDYERDRYSQKIPYCRRNVESNLKSDLYDLYEIPEKCRKRYTIDHIIPLSIGGDNSAQNLWPEHKNIKATRPYLEEEVFVAVRDGQMTQKEAVEMVLKIKTSPKEPIHGNSDCD